MIELAHENRLVVGKTIALLREEKNYLNMEAKVKPKKSECTLCAAVSKNQLSTRQPLEP